MRWICSVLEICFILSLVSSVLGQVIDITECQLLNTPGAEYVLQDDISYEGTCFAVDGDDITLNLNGHTVLFYNPDPLDYSFGLLCHPSYSPPGRPASWRGGGDNFMLVNGHIIQAASDTRHADTSTGTMSHAVYARSCNGFHIENMTLTANSQYDATILRLRSSRDVIVKNVTIYNNVRNITNRHYPGQRSILLEAGSGNCDISENTIIGGPHGGIAISGTYDDCQIHHNTISHDQRYVNGYAISASGTNLDIHHNTIVPRLGRGVHITGTNIDFHHNYLNLKLKTVVDHYSTDDYHIIFTNVHGIKFEGSAKDSRAYSNTVITTQPEEGFAPPTPLNLDADDYNSNIEVFNNNFTAITYAGSSTRNTGYGNYAEYAVGMIVYECNGDKTGYIHNNNFYTNDIAYWNINSPCSDYVISENNFYRIEPHTSNSQTFVYSNSGYNTFTDNNFIGFSPDDVYTRAGSGHDLNFVLAVQVLGTDDQPIRNPQLQIRNSFGEIVFDSTGDVDGKITLTLPYYSLDGSEFTYYSPYTLSYGSRDINIDLSESMFIMLRPDSEETYHKCGHGAVTERCMCEKQLIESNYCCYDTVSAHDCGSFEFSTCDELGGYACDRQQNTCEDGEFRFSSDLGTDCCTGICISDPESCDEADISGFGIISSSELAAYISLWLSGDADTMQIIDSIEKWKNGC